MLKSQTPETRQTPCAPENGRSRRKSLQSQGLLAWRWTQGGPVDMARREQPHEGTPGPHRPRKSDVSGIPENDIGISEQNAVARSKACSVHADRPPLEVPGADAPTLPCPPCARVPARARRRRPVRMAICCETLRSRSRRFLGGRPACATGGRRRGAVPHTAGRSSHRILANFGEKWPHRPHSVKIGRVGMQSKFVDSISSVPWSG